jgi:hypothetical protein
MSFKKLYDSSPSELKKIVVDQWKAKQNPKWHPEGNTLKHIITVTNRAFRDFPDNKDIQLAAYFHDLGKLATYKVNPKTGEPTAYGHEKESTDLIDKFSDFVKKQGADPEIVKYIVINHMKIKPSTWDVMKPSKKDDIINSPHYKDLEKFGTIDKGGLLELKYTNSKDKKTKKFITEISRFQKLAGIKSNFSLLSEAVEVPDWLKKKLEDVHTKPGQGSIFAKSIDDVLKISQAALDKETDIEKIANGSGTLTIDSPGIGYNLVLPIDKAKKLAGAKESEVEKIEGPNKIKVPAITTTAPLSQFKSNQLTIIVRPKKDAEGKVIPNEYIVLSAFPGDPTIPRASEWNGKYAVIIPPQESINESTDEEKEERVYNLFYNETQYFTGIRNYETGSDSDWDRVKDYIQKEKQNFLYNNKDISEEEFDAYYDKFLDYIEEQRGYESRNQQDLKMSFPWN